jgi:hypothetical protein
MDLRTLNERENNRQQARQWATRQFYTYPINRLLPAPLATHYPPMSGTITQETKDEVARNIKRFK